MWFSEGPNGDAERKGSNAGKQRVKIPDFGTLGLVFRPTELTEPAIWYLGFSAVVFGGEGGWSVGWLVGACLFADIFAESELLLNTDFVSKTQCFFEQAGSLTLRKFSILRQVGFDGIK